MNASRIFQQIMKQAGGQSGSQGDSQGDSQSSSGSGVKDVVDGLSRQLGGGGSGSGVDMKSLLGGGALGALVGSKGGRRMGGKALKYGAIAGVGALAWKAWKSSQQSSSGDEGGQEDGNDRVEVLDGDVQERRSLELLKAMIMAARADGHIDEQEQALISGQIEDMGADEELNRWVEQTLEAPLDAEALASEADSPQAAREMYLVSVAVVDEQNPMERAWLDQLGSALGLGDDVTAELERQAQQAN
ncbi:tellurite resistance TerB family protein [Halomonas garicola]|uniref:tellurite resistance TerB family protein n=1 Tax=Halomonas garicola TaxID=1690008 RepID=UPI00289E94C1|nr:tellurite resistance TerB family protein [Halomonas garicola]